MNEGFDTINLSNLNVHFAIPIVNKSGRKLGFYYNLQYDSTIWVPITSGSTTAWTPVKSLNGGSNWGWTLDTDAITGMVAETTISISCGYYDGVDQEWYVSYPQNTFAYDDSTSTSHGFGSYTGGCPATNYNSSYGRSGGLVTGNLQNNSISNEPASDGSGYVLNVPTSGAITITTRSGHVLNPPVNSYNGQGTITDPNILNQVTFNSNGTFFDETSNQILAITGSASAPPREYTYPMVGGSTTYIAARYTTYSIQTDFGCTGVSEYGTNGNKTASLISEIDLPSSGGSYLFTYEPTPGKAGFYTGRIASVTLPTGGTITYTYSTLNTCKGIQADGSGYELVRTTNDQTPAPTTTFDRSTAGQTKVTSPANGLTTIYFKNWYETKRVIGSLRTIDTCYNGVVPNLPSSDCTGQSVSGNFTEKASYVTLDNGWISEVDTKYGNYGEALTVDEYDFGSALPLTLLRETALTYQYGSSVPVLLTDSTVWSPPGKTGGTKLAETSYSYSSDGKGNLTGVTQGPLSGPQLSSSTVPNTYGMPASSTDPSNHTTSYGYDTTNTYVTTTTLPTTTANNSSQTQVSHSVSAQYDAYTGLVTSTTDDNGQQTKYYYDGLWRLYQVVAPDQGQTTYVYTSPNLVEVEQTLSTTSTAYSETLADGFGRTISTGFFIGSSQWTRQDTCYDVMGRVQYVSSSYTGSDLGGTIPPCPSTVSPGDQYTYDSLNRVVQVTHVNGSALQYAYTGRATEISEESNGSYRRRRIVQNDGIGRLTDACEVLASGDSIAKGSPIYPINCGLDIGGTGLNGFDTKYGYNPLGQLTSVAQPGVSSNRFWFYDTLQRVTQEVTPEAGTIGSQYVPQGQNGAGQLSVLTRPAPNNETSDTIDTYYNYDEWGRLITKNYFNTTSHKGTAEPNTPVANFLYDVAPGWPNINQNQKSHMTEAWTVMPAKPTTIVTATAFDYDIVGRASHASQCTPSTCSQIPGKTPFPMAYTYNNVGEVTSLAKDTRVTFTYNYDGTARLNQVTSTLNTPTTLISNIVYGPFGPQSDLLGNGISETYTYGVPSSGQIPFFTGVNAAKSGTTKYSLGLSVAGNGFIYGANDSVNGNWSYGYDSLNRMVSASKTGTTLSWAYDLPGNRWNEVENGTAIDTYAFANNLITTGTYDAAGNLLKDFIVPPVNTYTYDAEGRLYQVNGGLTATYNYDAFGRRVSGPNYEYVYDIAEHPVTLLQSRAPVADEIFIGARHLATYVGGNTYFVHSDHLGTERARTDASGAVCGTTTNLPFGDFQTIAGTCSDPGGRTIGGMEYDPEDGMNHTQYRKYYSTLGRWMTPDPAGATVADITNPQTWNRYGYVSNNPMTFIDSFGLENDCGGPCTPFVQSLGGDATRSLRTTK